MFTLVKLNRGKEPGYNRKKRDVSSKFKFSQFFYNFTIVMGEEENKKVTQGKANKNEGLATKNEG